MPGSIQLLYNNIRRKNKKSKNVIFMKVREIF